MKATYTKEITKRPKSWIGPLHFADLQKAIQILNQVYFRPEYLTPGEWTHREEGDPIFIERRQLLPDQPR